jgi:hypothetical protein
VEVNGALNLRFTGEGGAYFDIHQGKAGTPFEVCDTARIGCAADPSADKWLHNTQTCSNADVSYAMSWQGRNVPAGGEWQLLICGGNARIWAQPVTNIAR